MATVQASIPPLMAGDKMTLKEFLRRWEQMPEVKFAELIDGVVYMPSPVFIAHGDNENNVGTWLGVYAVATPGCKAANNATAVVAGHAPQPDIHMRLLREARGRTRIVDKLLYGAPELTAEICASSTSFDLHQKLQVYQKNKVQEYLAVLIQEREIRWHQLVKGKFRLRKPNKDGVFRSRIFPGLWLDGTALLAGDMEKVLAILQEGLASDEHAAFVRKLKKRMKR